MGIRDFEEVEIRSVMVDVGITITQNIIAKLLGATNIERFILNTKESSLGSDAIKTKLFELLENIATSSYF